MALNVLISECWWLVWCVIHLLNGHILSITVCPEVCTGTSPMQPWCGASHHEESLSRVARPLPASIFALMISPRKVEGRKQSGYVRLEEDMMWRQSTGREGNGCWKDVRTPWSSLMLARCMESLQLAALSSWWVCWVHVSRDFVTSLRSFSNPPMQLGKGQ